MPVVVSGAAQIEQLQRQLTHQQREASLQLERAQREKDEVGACSCVAVPKSLKSCLIELNELLHCRYCSGSNRVTVTLQKV